MKEERVLSGVAVAGDGTRLMTGEPRDGRIQFRCPASLVAAIDAAAEETHTTRTRFVETAILDRLAALGWKLK